MGTGALFAAVFLACIVEAVEATTIVLAAGTTREWRSTLIGVGAGLVSLAVVVAVLGPAVSALPLGVLRIVVGALLLVFRASVVTEVDPAWQRLQGAARRDADLPDPGGGCPRSRNRTDAAWSVTGTHSRWPSKVSCSRASRWSSSS